jgi:hypothetical protein
MPSEHDKLREKEGKKKHVRIFTNDSRSIDSFVA